MIKKNTNDLVTNKSLDKKLDEVVDTIIQGMDDLLKEERKFNVQTFATKEDLSREAGWLKDDIKGLTADLSGVPSGKDFNKLKGKVDKYLAS